MATGPNTRARDGAAAEFARWNADCATEIGVEAAEALEAERAEWRAAVGPAPFELRWESACRAA